MQEELVKVQVGFENTLEFYKLSKEYKEAITGTNTSDTQFKLKKQALVV